MTVYVPAETGEYLSDNPQFSCSDKYLKDKEDVSLHLTLKYQYLSLEIICSSELAFFLELCPQKTVHFLEQIISVDKYPNLLLCQMDTNSIFYNNCLICLALIGSFLSSMRVQRDKILIYESFQVQVTFNCQTVNFLTNEILWTFLSGQSKSEGVDC